MTPPIQNYAAFLLKCHEVVQFCKASKLFAEWPKETLLLYIAWHSLEGSLFVHREEGSIDGVAFAWRDCAQDIREKFGASKPLFDWHRARHPDCVFVADIVASKAICKVFIQQAMKEWPAVNHFIAHRRGKLLNITRTIERLRKGGGY